MLMNQLYNSGFFPTTWKCAITVPIKKKEQPTEKPDNYHPIALLTCLSKVYECAVKDRLVKECYDLSIFPPDQCGFLLGRTTSLPLVKFDNDIVCGINRRMPTIACFLDIEKTFDTIWIYKMHFNFSAHICQIVYHYLKNRKFVVKINNTTSSPYDSGVPQGGVLSAILYNIYTSLTYQNQQHMLTKFSVYNMPTIHSYTFLYATYKILKIALMPTYKS